MTSTGLLISLVFMGISFLVSMVLKSKINKYGKVGLANGMSGREIAEKMLRDNGIYDVQVISTPGFLSDHYDPTKKTVNLSPDIYEGRSIAAAAVAAHECGHAVQHATGYGPLQFRSRMVPAVQISSNLVNIALIAGLALAYNGNSTLLLIAILLMAITVVFSLVTLPVEFDASNRAIAWLDQSHITTPAETPGAKDALKWAATTYVVAALASVAQLIHYIMIFMGTRRDD